MNRDQFDRYPQVEYHWGHTCGTARYEETEKWSSINKGLLRYVEFVPYLRDPNSRDFSYLKNEFDVIQWHTTFSILILRKFFALFASCYIDLGRIIYIELGREAYSAFESKPSPTRNYQPRTRRLSSSHPVPSQCPEWLTARERFSRDVESSTEKHQLTKILLIHHVLPSWSLISCSFFYFQPLLIQT